MKICDLQSLLPSIATAVPSSMMFWKGLVHAILKGQSGHKEAPVSSQPRSCASSQHQAPASRAEQITAQLEGSTLCRDYTICTDDQALLGEGGQACAIRHVHSSIGCSIDFASLVIYRTAASPLRQSACVPSRSAGLAYFGCAAGSTTTGKGRITPSRCSSRDRGACSISAVRWQR